MTPTQQALALDALRAMTAGCEYTAIQGDAAWHVKTMPRDSALDLARAAIASLEAAPAAPKICSIGQCTMEKCNDTGRCERHYGAAPAAVAEPAINPTAMAVQFLIRARYPDGCEVYLDQRGVYDLGGWKVGIDVHLPEGVGESPMAKTLLADATPPPTEPSAEVVLPEPFVPDWPEYHSEAMGCGLEDRGIRDRYEAMAHGWECAVERCAECVPDVYTAEQVRAAILADRAARGVREPLTDEQIDGLNGLDTASRVRFYEHDFYVLSNFSAFRLRWRDIDFDTSEHAYHCEKFFDTVVGIAHEIQGAESAHEAFKIAERNKHLRRHDWDDVKVSIMLGILRAKAAQHEYVRRKLLATGDRELVEDSWRDDYWGWGQNRDGKNMLGKLWMQVRAELRGITPTAPTQIGAVK